MLSTAPEDLRSFTVIADFGMMLGQEDIADAAYEKAKRLVTEETHFAGRYMLAKHAFWPYFRWS